MTETPLTTAQLVYSLVADDVRLEVGNKLSVMGIFQNFFLQMLPAPILKFMVLNHWVGNGDHTTQLKIINPQRSKIVAATEPSAFSLAPGGFADNVTVFANVVFEEEGPHAIQIYLDGIMVREAYLNVVVPPRQNPTVN
jgi:hypothetical protein